MAVAYVQSKATGNAATATTVAVTLDAAVMSGNAVIIWVRAVTAEIVSMTDDKGNSFQHAHDQGNSRCYYKTNITNAPITFTLTVTPTVTHLQMHVHEVSGLLTLSPFDAAIGQQQTNPGTGTNAVSSGEILTSRSGDYIFGASYDPTLTHNQPYYSAGTGFTKRQEVGSNPTVINSISESQIQAAAGVIAATFTFTDAASDPVSMVVAFKAAGITHTASSGSYSISGLSTVLRQGSTMHLRYRK
jgi:hypothetical protein